MKNGIVIALMVVVIGAGFMVFSSKFDISRGKSFITVTLPQQYNLIEGSPVLVHGFTRGQVTAITRQEKNVTFTLLFGDSAVKTMSDSLAFALKKGSSGEPDSLFITDRGDGGPFQSGKHYTVGEEVTSAPVNSPFATDAVRDQLHYGLNLFFDVPAKVRDFEQNDWSEVKKSITEKTSRLAEGTTRILQDGLSPQQDKEQP